MKQTTFGTLKNKTPFYTKSEHKTQVYPNGVRQDFIKVSVNTAESTYQRFHFYGFNKNDIVYID